MNVRKLRELCGRLRGADERLYGAPSNFLAYSVGGKIFAYFKTSNPEKWRFSTRVTPERFVELTDHPGVKPARYRGRYHWITIVDVRRFPGAYLTELVECSHQRAFASLSKARQIAIRGESSLAMEATMKVNGSCHCGAITYEAEVDPDRVSICNCTDCQVLTGSAFRVSVPAAAQAFRLLTGSPSVYVKTADSGNKRRHSFCPTCGTPVAASADSDDPPSYSLRVGCLTQKVQLPPRKRIWCKSELAWAQNVGTLPGIRGQ
ncbi:MAG TPA: GFA family protein [Casimicrobiaceae bacterium]|nr:GFA family protein [Casimicrobiaceae bacterium]